MGRRAAPPHSEPTGPKGAGFRPAQTPAGPKLPRPLSALYSRFRPGAGGGAAAVRAQTEMEIPQKFPACALGRGEFQHFFGHSLEEKGGLCMKKKWTIAAVLVLAVALLAVGTWAYFSAVGRADNVITMGSVKLALHDEDGSGRPFTTVSAMPGSVVDKVVYVENVGSGAFYTRVKITPEVVAANGEIIPLDASKRLLTLDLNDTDWIPGTDGYYYYNGTLSPKAATSKLFNHVTFSKDMGNEYQNTTVHIYVTAEAVQTANLDKYGPIDVWKHVGTVEASTSSTQIDPIPTA